MPERNRAVIREFTYEKTTPGTVRFTEDEAEDGPPIIGTLYLKKWWVKEGQRIRITVEVVDGE